MAHANVVRIAITLFVYEYQVLSRIIFFWLKESGTPESQEQDELCEPQKIDVRTPLFSNKCTTFYPLNVLFDLGNVFR